MRFEDLPAAGEMIEGMPEHQMEGLKKMLAFSHNYPVSGGVLERSMIVLAGVVGSTAYGMATKDSDVDRMAIWAAAPKHFMGLEQLSDRSSTVVTHHPDVVQHEARKFLLLALNGNPSVNELLWLPEYEAVSELGRDLLDMRTSLLSGPRVHEAYLNYAKQQFERLKRDQRFPDVPRERIAKHARHLLRLLDQGTELYATGELTLQVRNANRYFNFGIDIVRHPDLPLVDPFFHRAEEIFDGPTPLRAEPDREAAERWLIRLRGEMVKAEAASGLY